MSKELSLIEKSLSASPSIEKVIQKDKTRKMEANLRRTPKILAKNNNLDFVPVDVVENELDTVFGAFGWSSEIISTTVIAQEFVVTIHLTVWVEGRAVTRLGIGAVPIEQEKGAAIMDISQKKKNALQKNAPAAAAYAFKNAAKKFGNRFGRNLNRANKGEFDQQDSVLIDAELADPNVAKTVIANTLSVMHFEDTAKLEAVFRALPTPLKSRADIVDLFKGIKNEILNRPKSDNPNE
jgi:hypothetical protein